MYTIMLTKAAIMHRDYLAEYDKYVPQEMLAHIDKMRNCEDIAMAQVVAKKVRVRYAQWGPELPCTYVWNAVLFVLSIWGISSVVI
jgi:hypothetical protein